MNDKITLEMLAESRIITLENDREEVTSKEYYTDDYKAIVLRGIERDIKQLKDALKWLGDK